jgi:hypothetical protein
MIAFYLNFFDREKVVKKVFKKVLKFACNKLCFTLLCLLTSSSKQQNKSFKNTK